MTGSASDTSELDAQTAGFRKVQAARWIRYGIASRAAPPMAATRRACRHRAGVAAAVLGDTANGPAALWAPVTSWKMAG
jgi:hypothetical protein